MSTLVDSYISIRCVAGKKATETVVQVDLYSTEELAVHQLLIFAMAQNPVFRNAIFEVVEKWDTPEMRQVLNDAGEGTIRQ